MPRNSLNPQSAAPGATDDDCPAGRFAARWCAAAAGLLWMLAGCAGYQLGAHTLYPTNLRTVAVPVFESVSFRRNFGERLTEAVIKQIELRTPYKVVPAAYADSVLSGKVVGETKRVIAETPRDEPRDVEIEVAVEVVWTDRRGAILADGMVPVPLDAALVTQSSHLVPEVGQSVVVVQQQAIDRLAAQIVSLMEAPWPGEPFPTY